MEIKENDQYTKVTATTTTTTTTTTVYFRLTGQFFWSYFKSHQIFLKWTFSI